MKNLFPNTGTYRRGRYSGSKKHIRTGVPCDGCSHCDSKCCTEADCVCVDCPPAGITKRGQLKIIDNRNPGAKFMNNLFPNTYRGDRYSHLLRQTDCRKFCINKGKCSRYGLGLNRECTNCRRKCEADQGLVPFLNDDENDNTGGSGGGTGGGGNGGGGNGGGGNGGGANGNGEGPDTQTIMIWTGVALLLITLIIGGAIAIKKIRT